MVDRRLPRFCFPCWWQLFTLVCCRGGYRFEVRISCRWPKLQSSHEMWLFARSHQLRITKTYMLASWNIWNIFAWFFSGICKAFLSILKRMKTNLLYECKNSLLDKTKCPLDQHSVPTVDNCRKPTRRKWTKESFPAHDCRQLLFRSILFW